MNTFKKLSKTLIYAAMILFNGYCTLSIADDTEIYVGGSSLDTAFLPNLLFVLDQSGSMNWNVDTDSSTTPPIRIEELKSALRTVLSGIDNVNIGIMSFANNANAPVRYPIAYVNDNASTIEGTTDLLPPNPVIATSSDDAWQYTSITDIPNLTSATLNLGHNYSTSPVTRTYRIDDDKNDAEQRNDGTGTSWHDSDELNLPRNGTNLHYIGLRYPDATHVPKDATILNAKAGFVFRNDSTQPNDITIYAQNTSDNVDFDTGGSNNNISKRIPTIPSTVSWPNTVAGKRGDTIYTPNLSSLIQPLVQSTNWSNSSKRNIVLIMEGTGTGEMKLYSHNGKDNESDKPWLELTYVPAGTTIKPQTIGLRYSNTRIPQGTTITEATLTFTAAADSSDNMDINIYAEATDNAAPFAATANNIGARSKTTDVVNWKLTGLTSRWKSGDEVSVDITPLIQKTIDRDNWCGGNALSLLLETLSEGSRLVHSYNNGDPALAPKLNIKYSATEIVGAAPTRAGVTYTGCNKVQYSAQISQSDDDVEEATSNGTIYKTSNQLDFGDNTIGLRFQPVEISPSAVVTDARLVFTSDTSTSGTTNLVIRGQKSLDPATFSSTAYDVSSTTVRPNTTESVSWTLTQSLTSNQEFSSPNISAVVTEILGQSGWIRGNDIAFKVSGTGTHREIKSYNNSVARAPRLDIIAQDNRLNKTVLPPVTVRDRLIQIVESISPTGGTPLVDAYHEAAQYFRGGPVNYGKSRLNNSSYRVSHPATYAYSGTAPNPKVNRDANCTDANLSASACSSEAIQGSPNYITPIKNACATNHIVLLTDGVPTINNSQALIKSMMGSGSTCATVSGVPDGTCGYELATYLAENDQSTGTNGQLGDQIIKTHTVAFALSNNTAKTYLSTLANKGDGGYYVATDATSLVSAFKAIAQQIVDEPSSFSAPTLSVNAFNRLQNNRDIYFSLFKPSIKPSWDGNVKHFRLCSTSSCSKGEVVYLDGTGAEVSAIDPATGVIKANAVSIWSDAADGPEVTKGGAGAEIPAHATRRVLTYTGTNDRPTTSVTLNTTSHRLEDSNAAITQAMLGVSSATERTKMINWIRGQDVDDLFDGTDDRWGFGDPLHSSPIAVTYGKSSATPAVPVTKLLVGTNDGGIRMINANTGVEEWVFIPKELLGRQKQFRENSGSDKLYGVDGTPSISFNDIDGDGIIEPADGDYVHLYIGMRRGGSNYYALDITPSAVLTTPSAVGEVMPKFMWSIKSGDTDYERLGQTWSRPLVTRMRMVISSTSVIKNVLIFGGGYDEGLDNSFALDNTAAAPGYESMGNAIYVVDALTGVRLWSGSSSTGATTNIPDMKYSIPSDIALLDHDGDTLTDRLYVADMGGQLWRVDFDDTQAPSNTAFGTAGKLAELSATSTTSEINKRRFFYPPDVVEVVDTVYSDTPRYDLILMTSGNRANPLSKEVHDRMYAIRDFNVPSLPATGYAINTSSLLDVTNITFTENTSATTIDDLKDGPGWFINLNDFNDNFVGEKGLSKGITIASTYFFTTYIPPASATASACKPNVGTGNIYNVNVLNGTARYNWQESNSSITRHDRSVRDGAAQPIGIPSEVVPVFNEDGITLIVGSGGGATTLDPNIGLPRYKTYWSEQ